MFCELNYGGMRLFGNFGVFFKMMLLGNSI